MFLYMSVVWEVIEGKDLSELCPDVKRMFHNLIWSVPGYRFSTAQAYKEVEPQNRLLAVQAQ